MKQNHDDDDAADAVVVCPIPLDRDTRRRLKNFADACGERPLAIAAVLLSELLRDDELYHAAINPAPPQLN